MRSGRGDQQPAWLTIAATSASPWSRPPLVVTSVTGPARLAGQRATAFVTLAGRVDHLYLAARSLWQTSTGLALEDDRHRLLQQAGGCRVADVLHERPSGAGPIVPRSRWRCPTTLAASINSIGDILADAHPWQPRQSDEPSVARKVSARARSSGSPTTTPMNSSTPASYLRSPADDVLASDDERLGRRPQTLPLITAR